MTPTVDNIINGALSLPNGERVEIVEAIIASLRPEDRPPFDESWREVILRRSEELKAGKVAAVPWEQVKARARKRARG